ncbi:hypothetical protein [Clostridium sp. DL1XJH146]
MLDDIDTSKEINLSEVSVTENTDNSYTGSNNKTNLIDLYFGKY